MKFFDEHKKLEKEEPTTKQAIKGQCNQRGHKGAEKDSAYQPQHTSRCVSPEPKECNL